MFSLNCKGRLLVIDQPIVMGIINVTPDSFYEGSRAQKENEILKLAGKMISEGATILDIGGQSTRPGSETIDAKEESKRVVPCIKAIRKRFPDVFISIDSFYAEVVLKAVEHGADLVNDISAGAFDEQLIPLVANLKVPYVLMHMKGTPQTMKQFQQYENVTVELLDFFYRNIAGLKSLGIADIIIDPGFGFAKNSDQNFELLKHLEIFKQLHVPILAGISRKGMVYRTLNVKPEEALNGTTVLNTIALNKGASILRVHDVKPAMEAIQLLSALT